ncbi:acyl-CoA N-acyltransferase [Auricularia subglabra TFB-10046 SS5]|uniref:Acyl-CoA N-acyltransferase n=1 Tax=Auricularia subglabra (strain TFB-10046 / SS5) TaxID=717982 RepID=J0LEU8_AURST|nr:acyl-CoA N-acyltransferase [Auricularia subglabra TFB-10046 SS5]
MPAHIRPARLEDMPAISRISLLTGRAGQSAEDDHRIGGLPGSVWAEPYVAAELKPDARTFAFVLVNDDAPDLAVGYIVGTADTRAYERVAEERWWPALRTRHPLTSVDDRALMDADRQHVRLLHKPDLAPQNVIEFSPAHVHISLLPSHQRQGWGHRLLDAAVSHLRGEGLDALHLVVNPRNNQAKQFYLKVGFERLPTDERGYEYYGLRSSRFTSFRQ